MNQIPMTLSPAGFQLQDGVEARVFLYTKDGLPSIIISFERYVFRYSRAAFVVFPARAFDVPVDLSGFNVPRWPEFSSGRALELLLESNYQNPAFIEAEKFLVPFRPETKISLELPQGITEDESIVEAILVLGKSTARAWAKLRSDLFREEVIRINTRVLGITV